MHSNREFFRLNREFDWAIRELSVVIREIAISPRSGDLFGAIFALLRLPLRSLKLRRMHGHSKDHLLSVRPVVKVVHSTNQCNII